MRNLPVAEAHSDLVAPRTGPPPISLSAYLRDARTRAEEILRQHPHRAGRTGPACQLCLVAYPCDAVRAAEDVIEISVLARAQAGPPRTG